jgi:hypothetical protein
LLLEKISNLIESKKKETSFRVVFIFVDQEEKGTSQDVFLELPIDLSWNFYWNYKAFPGVIRLISSSQEPEEMVTLANLSRIYFDHRERKLASLLPFNPYEFVVVFQSFELIKEFCLQLCQLQKDEVETFRQTGPSEKQSVICGNSEKHYIFSLPAIKLKQPDQLLDKFWRKINWLSFCNTEFLPRKAFRRLLSILFFCFKKKRVFSCQREASILANL